MTGPRLDCGRSGAEGELAFARKCAILTQSAREQVIVLPAGSKWCRIKTKRQETDSLGLRHHLIDDRDALVEDSRGESVGFGPDAVGARRARRRRMTRPWRTTKALPIPLPRHAATAAAPPGTFRLFQRARGVR